MKIMQPNSQTDKDYWRKFVRKLNLVSIAKNKDPSISVKIHQTFYNAICLISAEWMSGFDLFNMSCLSSIFLMDIFDVLYYNSLNLKNRITKIEHKKIFCGPSKILKNIYWPINVFLKYSRTPTKTLRLAPHPFYT